MRNLPFSPKTEQIGNLWVVRPRQETNRILQCRGNAAHIILTRDRKDPCGIADEMIKYFLMIRRNYYVPPIFAEKSGTAVICR